MPKLVSFMMVSLDGYFADAHNDMSWAHKDPNDAEWNAFVAGNASSGGTLLFGRVTHDLMVQYWPTPLAMEQAPVVAERMNTLPKVVFSRTLKTSPWTSTRLVSGGLASEVRRLKDSPGPQMAILGSGSIVAQLAQEGLIDEYQVVVNPIALGAGKSLFAGLTRPLPLELTSTRTFANGNVLLTYAPAASRSPAP